MKTEVYTMNAPAPIGPFSQAIKAQGTFLYVSGNIGIKDGALVAGGIKAQTQQALDNINAVLREAGYSFQDVVKVNVFITNMDDFGAINEVYASYFSKPEPARTTVQVSRLPREAIVEIELTAVK
ncbi:MAG: deaminase [Mucilaginibacter sp.]|nr:deaminase [Mucilaginibacter sp.]